MFDFLRALAVLRWAMVTLAGACFHGSPSTCAGIAISVVISSDFAWQILMALAMCAWICPYGSQVISFSLKQIMKIVVPCAGSL